MDCERHVHGTLNKRQLAGRLMHSAMGCYATGVNDLNIRHGFVKTINDKKRCGFIHTQNIAAAQTGLF